MFLILRRSTLVQPAVGGRCLPAHCGSASCLLAANYLSTGGSSFLARGSLLVDVNGQWYGLGHWSATDYPEKSRSSTGVSSPT